jgi:hypothetical protein
MLTIANNITTRNSRVNQIFGQAKAGGWTSNWQAATRLGELAEQCVAAGADALEINIQQHHDLPQAMEFAVNAVQQVTNRRLCLSTNNIQAVEAGLRVSKHPPLVNYLSIDEAKLKKMLPLVASHGAGAILLVSDPTAPADAQGMLQKAAILIGAANEAGIPNDDILVDPGLIHITSDMGQRHLAEVIERSHRPPGEKHLLAGQLLGGRTEEATFEPGNSPPADAGRRRAVFGLSGRPAQK